MTEDTRDLAFLKFFLDTPLYSLPAEEVVSTVAEDPAEITAPEPSGTAQEIHYLGENKQGTVCLVNIPGTDFYKSAEYHFLQKILEAVRLTFHEACLVNQADNPAMNMAVLQQQLRPEKVLMFGPELASLEVEEFGRKLQPYRRERISDMDVLLADPLAIISASRDTKRALWEGLKEIFGT